MVPRIIVDASVILSLILPEEMYANLSRSFMTSYLVSGTVLHAPTLIDYEVANAIRSAVMSKRIKPEEVLGLEKLYSEFPLERISFEGIFEKSIALSLEQNCSVYDASYVVAAELYACPLVTLDKKLARIFHKSEYVWYLPDLTNS